MPILKLHPATPQEQSFQWSGPRCDLGRAPTNHLQLEDVLVSTFHARIELRDGDYWLIDLNSTNGTFLNGVPVHEAQLRDGDEIRLGQHLKLKFTIPAEPATKVVPPEATVVSPEVPPPTAVPGPGQMPTPMPAQAGSVPAGQQAIQMFQPATTLAPQGMICPQCRVMLSLPVNFCPRCGFSLAQQASLGFPMQPQPVGFVRPMDQPGGMSIGLLPVLAWLCGLFGLFPFAIILGLTALGQIRRLGGVEADRKQALWGIGLGFAWALVAAAIGGYWSWGKYQERQQIARIQQRELTDKQIAENEANTITLLKGIARGQRLAKLIRVKDPNRTGTGQYLTLAELTAAGTTFVSRDLATGQAHGYRFSIVDPNEADYLAIAEPLAPGQTGRRVLAVDSSGLVRGLDAGGRSYAQLGGNLPILSNEQSAFHGVEDAIAAEAIAHAKKLAAAGRYEECQSLLDDIAAQFPMTTTGQELTAIKKTVDPFIIEAQAKLKHQKVAEAIAKNDQKLAIALLQEITELYPTYSRISAVTEELTFLETALSQRLDKEAKTLFEQAEALEREGKPEAALDVYVQIEKNYPTTDYAKRIGELRPALLKSIREMSAEQLFSQARELSITNDCRTIVNLIQQLQRNYADTDYVSANKESIGMLFQKAQAEYYRSLAMEQMLAGRDADALARLEEACQLNPDSRPLFRDLFLKLYLRVAGKRTEEADYREALRLYRSYLALEPEKNELPDGLLSKLQFALARSDFIQGNYYGAAQLLVSARKDYEKDPDYNDLFASVQVALGNYLDALPYYDKAIAAKPSNGNYWARRGYTQLLLALQTERETMAAYAGFLREPAPRKESKPAVTDTNSPPAPAPPTTPNTKPTSEFEPTFATVLPPTASGTKPEMQVRYDAATSQSLLEQALDFLDAISASNATARVRTAIQQQPRGGGRGAANGGSGTSGGGNTTPDPTDGGMTGPSRTRDRIERIRSSVEFNKALSSLRQRIADSNARQARSADAMRRMVQYFTNGNRDLSKAIELGADRAPDLMEILKVTQQHERKVAQAVPLIITYVATEIDIIERVCQMAETVYQNMRVQYTHTPIDPTSTLDVYFSRYFDRRDFDRGTQILREAASLKVPLEAYSLIPAVPVVPAP